MKEIELFKKAGFGEETAKVLARAVLYCSGKGDLSSEEKDRWRKVGVMEGNKFLLDRQTAKGDLLGWVLLGLVYEGVLKRELVKKEGSR